jgi:hypothetical protein
MNFGKLITSLAVAGAIAGGAYVFIHNKHITTEQAERLAHAEPSKAPSVTVSRVTMNDFVETAVVSGSLIPREEILVSPEIEG